MSFLRNLLITARQELDDAIRSRRAAAVLVLYLAGSVLVCNGFISVLYRLEQQLTRVMGLPPASSPGVVMNSLWKSEEFRRMIDRLVGDPEAARQLTAVHPMALMYGWLVFMATPLLVMLASTSRIAEETACGSVRFPLLRTSRLSWCVGKCVGQALMLVVALLLSAVGAWCVARLRLRGLSSDAAAGMAVFAAKAWLYSLGFLGAALGLSQITRGPNVSMALGFLFWMGSSFLAVAAKHFEGGGLRQLWTLAGLLLPQGHVIDLWRMDAGHLVPAVVWLLALGSTYLMAGYACFWRKDL